MNKKELKVVIGGKLIPLEDVKKEYEGLMLTVSPSNVRVIQTLVEAEKPLTRHEIAKKANITIGYASNILKDLIKKDIVIEFRIGKSRYLYYLLTEKGFEFSKTLKKE